jgi:anaerobic ribonucleoside-triphosphate reductase
MHIQLSYEQEFNDLIFYLQEKYPKELFNLEGIGDQLDMPKYSKKFFSQHANNTTVADNSVDANANVSDMSVISYVTELVKPFERLNSMYMLWKYSRQFYNTQFANMVVESQLIGDFYINDFHHFFLVPYCFNYSTYDIALGGLPYLVQPKCTMPKYLLTFKQQMEQFTVFASNTQSGAAGQADLLIIMSYFVKQLFTNSSDMHFKLENNEENLWAYVKDILTTYIYTINQPFRSNQSPFTNVSVYDKYFLENLCKDIYFADGSKPDINIINKLQKIFIDIMNEELERTPITYPVTTACFNVDKEGEILDKTFLKMISEKNLKWGFINLYTGSSSTLSSCCRLRSESTNEYFNSFGAGSTKIGSLGVVTLNLPRAAIKSNGDKNKLIKEVERLTEIACKINNIKRHILKQRIDNGNLPLYTYGYMELNKQYSTTGVNGLNETLYYMGEDILNESGQELQLNIIQAINKINDKMSKIYKVPTNAEQTPSENSAIKLCKKDHLLKYQDDFDIYSNQFIPLTTNADMLDRIILQGKFDKEFSGGAICHINVENKITKTEDMENLIIESAKKGVVYFAINYNLQKCKNGHMSVGKLNICPICSEVIIENYTRVVGFLTNVKNWNKTRRVLDYPNREFYKDIETEK